MSIIIAVCCFGCASVNRFNPDILDNHESQKRIVRQGFARVPVLADEWEAVFFGYDRNRDYSAQVLRDKGRGIDLQEYKRRLPNGHWEFIPFMILIDETFNGYVDWVCLDHDRDAVIDAVYRPASTSIHFDRIDFYQFKPFAHQAFSK